MKIRNYITIFLAVISIIVLLLLAGYMTYLNADDSNPFKQTVTAVIEEVNLEFGLGLDFEQITHPIPFKTAKPAAPAQTAPKAETAEVTTEAAS